MPDPPKCCEHNAKAFELLFQGTLFKAWVKANPGEAAKLNAYVAGDATVDLSGMRTFTGKALAEFAQGLFT